MLLSLKHVQISFVKALVKLERNLLDVDVFGVYLIDFEDGLCLVERYAIASL